MVKRQFDYEQKVQEIREKLEELNNLSSNMEFDLSQEIESLEEKIENNRERRYKNLSPWEKVLLSRHPERPNSNDYIRYFCEEWIELHGDRHFGDDSSVIGGIGRFNGQAVTILGYRKGKDTRENLQYNFGMPHPEGYRKIQRLLLQAEKFQRPVITLIDTPGAYPGIGAEERGQAWAISQVLMTLSALEVPVIAVVSGEGGSGGALALAVADRLLMLSNAVFSVASPEACASILWKELERVEDMARAMKITANDLQRLGIVDEIIEEPLGGAHLNFPEMAEKLKKALQKHLGEILSQDSGELLEERFQKLRKIGEFRG
ncbi:acetyl-CoA carboxylase carboxyltransferase subunit alpha [Syntrophomonas wolfei]|uniref:Acetyl-coenzyme A carboxylase carboxyl transferase subunit alpha n=1 Tax=Syntrophomonas wolfei subsp. wolfei (strain DSM 2245B / Goettingen) TaxID=335541 RepID=ACCA_SYNWW|nr:acetyl-CoA carboxylase carboxyltransferase subunit alpha [Syntrophomonas wolfei]Q0AVW1.1 RecName: Full=Acetyl-coenzyme A carboxylase carboxyl transferase subunit alpha; Short=ACCase subunit alpha; Short=Acetyl-CoA carboxylase carboxyltransferase subunit alpha [Syntrophomonas wolfei subsp. wolfei str. Goettingen G311]ABI69143.1 acetyl-coenzyme A carboxylase carboxyl transferase subunit alpha [Syntrophomonas wolfei subsp. wolfei str. Goettingen G311]